mgnify:CR=1 FL=1
MKKISIKWLWFIVIGLWLIVAGAVGNIVIRKYTSVEIHNYGFNYGFEGVTDLMHVGDEKELTKEDIINILEYLPASLNLSYRDKNYDEVIANFEEYKLYLENDCMKLTQNGIKAVKPGYCALFLEKDYKDSNYLKHRDKICIELYLIVDDTYEGFVKITTPMEFLTFLNENTSGKYILDNDLDFANVEYTNFNDRIINQSFSGVLINPKQYVIKNINTDKELLRSTGNAFIQGLILEDCTLTQDFWWYDVLGSTQDETIIQDLKIRNMKIIANIGSWISLMKSGIFKNCEYDIEIITTESTKETTIFPFPGYFLDSIANIKVSGPNKSLVKIDEFNYLESNSKIIIGGMGVLSLIHI